MTNTIPIYSNSFQVEIQVYESVISTEFFSNYYINARTSRYLNKYKGGWGCCFCFYNEKVSTLEVLLKISIYMWMRII